MERENLNKWLTRLFALGLVVLIITFSIALPIYFRPFYYMQMKLFDFTERAGAQYTDEMVWDAYNEVLNYLTLPGKEFGTGVFPHSDEGESHFRDVKVLFNLNAIALFVSLTTVITLYILNRKKIISLERKNGYHISYYVGKWTLIIFAVTALLVSINFDVAFDIFHRIFFPGKTNWYFDYNVDPIIWVLPQKFFMNCAILIVASIIIICASLITYNKIKKEEKENR